MRTAAWAQWRFSHRGQNPGPLTLREILDSGRCPAKGRIAAIADAGASRVLSGKAGTYRPTAPPGRPKVLTSTARPARWPFAAPFIWWRAGIGLVSV
jgi:hypothetical protein